MQTITIAPPKRSWFSLLSWAIVLAVLVVSWQGAEMAPLTLIKDGGNMATFAADFFRPISASGRITSPKWPSRCKSPSGAPRWRWFSPSPLA
ncbi:hypothetical protein ECZU34_17440 [Escherichia coli]|nr:hypothetical protein ECZU34_17440 [Escherichia coli]